MLFLTDYLISAWGSSNSHKVRAACVKIVGKKKENETKTFELRLRENAFRVYISARMNGPGSGNRRTRHLSRAELPKRWHFQKKKTFILFI